MPSQFFAGDKLVNKASNEKTQQKIKSRIIYDFEKLMKKCRNHSNLRLSVGATRQFDELTALSKTEERVAPTVDQETCSTIFTVEARCTCLYKKFTSRSDSDKDSLPPANPKVSPEALWKAGPCCFSALP